MVPSIGWFLGASLLLAVSPQQASAQRQSRWTDPPPASSTVLHRPRPSSTVFDRLQPSQATADEVDIFASTVASAALITAGLFTFKDEGFLNRQSIKDWRNTFIPDFADHSDDLGQVAAGGLALGLNAVGVPGRHKLFRAASTYATALAIETAAVFAGKGLTEVLRPDGSARNSFPSGHTAASFVSARFLDREYGHVSYLYSLGGYSLAAMTGVFRQLNNRHWLSDVLVGAGIGIMSTDIAYVAMGKAFREKGKHPPRPPGTPRPRANPSFVDFRVGYANHQGDLQERNDIVAEDGWTAGGEGAFFFSRYLGIGGEISVAAFPINMDKFVPDPDVDSIAEELNTQPFGTQSVFIGPFVNVPLGDRWSIVGKATAGWASGATATVTARVRPEFQEEFGTADLPLVVDEPKTTFGAMTGVSIRGRVSERIALRGFAEYYFSQPDYEIRSVESVDPDGNVVPGPVEAVENVSFNYFAVGLAVSAILW
jgi:membrane-associated phospholipid phosphatase